MYLCEVANKHRKHLLAPLLYTDIRGRRTMDVYIKYLDGKDERIEDVEVVKENSRMGFIDVTYKKGKRLIAEEGSSIFAGKLYRKRKILNFTAIESMTIIEEK